MINALILSVTLAGVANPTYVQCHLWKRFTDVNGQKICVYRFTAGFGGLGYHYPTKSFLNVQRFLAVFIKRKTSDQVCLKY